MRKSTSSILLILFFAISCSHPPYSREGMGMGKTMFYEYTIDEVREATLEVLIDLCELIPINGLIRRLDLVHRGRAHKRPEQNAQDGRGH